MHSLVAVAVAALSVWSLEAQILPNITAPKNALGFNLGDDYQVANYTLLEAWWKKLAAESPRMKLESIGKTEEGRDQWMAIITSPDNMKKLARYKEIARKLARAEGVSEPEARALAKEGKAIVWIDGGLHATETVGSQQLMEWVYQMVSRTDEETMRFLNDVIVLNVQANPDGQELVANWYMREKEPLRRSMNGLPRLYAKYVGHDDNRDFYMSNMKESTNMNRQLFLEWFPPNINCVSVFRSAGTQSARRCDGYVTTTSSRRGRGPARSSFRGLHRTPMSRTSSRSTICWPSRPARNSRSNPPG